MLIKKKKLLKTCKKIETLQQVLIEVFSIYM